MASIKLLLPEPLAPYITEDFNIRYELNSIVLSIKVVSGLANAEKRILFLILIYQLTLEFSIERPANKSQ